MQRREFITFLGAAAAVRAERPTALLREAGYLLLGLVSLATVTGLYFWLEVPLVAAAFTYLVILVLLSLVSNLSSLFVLSFIGVGCLNYFFAPPIYTFRIDYSQDLITICAFVITSFVVNFLVTRVRIERETLHDANERLESTNEALRIENLERKRAEHALQESEAKIRRLVDSNIIGVFFSGLKGRVHEANDAFLHLVGHDRDDLISGRIRWTDLTPPEWRERDRRALAELSSNTIARPYEKEFFRKDGSRVRVLIGGALFEEGGNEGVAFVVDLTELKCTEQALRESEAKFRDYAETASDWLWEIGPDYKYTLLTENAFGSNPAHRIGTTCWDHALDVETEPEKWRLVWETLDSHKPFRDFVFCAAGGSGAPMYVKASGKPVFDRAGKFRGYRGTGTDVTAIVRAQRVEASLRTVQAELARVSRVITLGQLTASIAHEVKQPIATARNNARAALNFLDKQPPDLGEVREALGCIVVDADRAGDIIDRIGNHIKKAPPQNDRFDLNAAINEVIVLAQTAIAENGVSVQTRLADRLHPVQGDRVQMQQVILNLVLNAVEAMGSVDAGARELVISAEQSQTNNILVAVRDSGPGIDPESLDRVFEAFYTTKSGGVGMGLSICRSIIEAHGGRLWATGCEPRGALFQFTIPAD
jgi:PAS domain S-box-containing protein